MTVMNNAKTVGLLVFLSVLVVVVANSLGASPTFALVLAGVINLGAYFFSDKLALAASRAKPVEEHELPQVYSIVRNLALRAEMPMPRIYLIEQDQPNAFATGRSPNKAAVAVTTGILKIMSQDELEGVLAHELSHVRNRDILIASIAAMLAAALTLIARLAFWFGGGRDERNNPLGAIGVILALVVAPLAAVLIRLAISRSREFQADRSGAELTKRPLNLASALKKIGVATQRIPMDVNPAVSQLYFENPRKAFGRRDGLLSLLSTHPPIEERIERLEQLSLV